MRWEELNGDRFPQAVQEAGGVCLLPLACLERHGHHLPIGTDAFIVREVCRRAAEIEPAVVFPDLLFTQILEARHTPGCVALEPRLILELMDSLCREIARNGLKKVVLVNGHGGNDHLIHFFTQAQLASRRDYVVYAAQPPYQLAEAESGPEWETAVDGHAGERETSAILAIRPDLVDASSLPTNGEGQPRGRLQGLRDLGIDTGIWWYADHPSHYCGDGRPATAHKGEVWFERTSQALARAIRAIKQDDQAPRLQEEFFERSDPD